MSRHAWIRLPLLCIAAIVLLPPPLAGAAPVTGAGSSAAAPVYRIWSEAWMRDGGPGLVYDSVGSSAGLARIRQRGVDFGASDVIPPEAELARDGLVAIPTVVTAAVPVVNLPRVGTNELRLTGPLLAGIFLGEIGAWNDPAIRALNPGVALPAAAIRVVVRADGSGTTANFADYLAKVSPEWKRNRGVRSAFDWPKGFIGAKGSEGVVAAVRGTPGAIGYVDYNYVVDHGLAAVRVRNAAGEFAAASVGAVRAAVLASAWNATGDFRGTLTDMPGPGAWPITMGTFVLLPRHPAAPEPTLQALRFIVWGLLRGDELAKVAKFVPLPERVQAKAYKALAGVTGGDGRSLGVGALAAP